MDEQFPQQQPIEPMQQPHQSKFTSKKFLVTVGIIILILIIAGIGILMWSSQKKSVGNISSNNVTVAGFKYANACRVFNADLAINHFGPLPNGGQFSNTFAEEGKEFENVPDSAGVKSSCFREFIDTSPYAKSTVIFEVVQYKTVEIAQKYYDNQSSTDEEKSELEESNEFFGTNILPADGEPLQGDPNTTFSPSQKTSYTLIDNKIIRFSAILGGASVEQYKKSIAGAMPGIRTNLKDDSLPQSPLSPGKRDPSNPNKILPLYGDKIGSATYLNPCETFTSQDFKSLTGSESNSSEVIITATQSATTALSPSFKDGYTRNSCKRRLPFGAGGGNTELIIKYYKTTAEANADIQTRVSSLSDPTRKLGTFSSVLGIGQYASYGISSANDFDAEKSTTFHVQQGPYYIEVRSRPYGKDDRALSSDSYKQALAAVLSRLP